MCAYDPYQRHRRLWNDPEDILNESLSGTVLKHQNLVYLDNCKAVLRRDCNKLNGKVRIIGGGAVIDGPQYAGFVGPGMLTAAVLGLHGSASSVPTSDSIFEVINYVVKDEQQPINEVLLLVHDCAEYFLNFLLAKSKAEGKGIPIRMILVRDEISDKLNQKPSSPASPSGLLLVYKIAGAMAEEGKNLEEIHNTCNDIVKNGLVFSIGAYITECCSGDVTQIELSRGDKLSDRDIKRFPISNLSAKKVIENIISDAMSADDGQKFPRGSSIALFLDYFGGFSELEVNILVKELVQQLNQLQLKIAFIYTGSFHTSLELYGFHLSIMNLSSNSELSYYLNAPTLAFAWPNTTAKGIELQTDTNRKNFEEDDLDIYKDLESENASSIQEKVTFADVRRFETDILLTAVEFACDTLIACAHKIDMLDKPSMPEEVDKCGTRLANTSEAIKTAVRKKKFVGSNLSNVIFQIALIFEQSVQDPQAELYTLFFNTIGKAIENQKCLEASDWLDAFVRAINAVDTITKGTKFSDTLFAAKAAFCDAYAMDDNVNVIHALGQAVSAAQKRTSHVIPDSGRIPENILNDKDCGFSGLAGAHAIGIWMRGAYEGFKLKYLRHRSREKRVHLNDFPSDDQMPPPKMPKFSDDQIPPPKMPKFSDD